MSEPIKAGSTTLLLVRRGAQFAAAMAVLLFGVSGLVAMYSPGSELSRAVWTSAVLAFVVQVIAFVVAVPFLAKNPIMGWGLGSVLRLFVLVLYALVGLKILALAAAPALLSLAGFLFASMLLESLFLKP